jgi:chaperonin GroES
MTIKPLEDRIVIKRSEPETKTAGGIILTESAQEKPQQGTVLAVGPGRQLENGQRAALDVSVGDVIYFGKYAGTDIQLDGEDVIIMKESDVLAIVK